MVSPDPAAPEVNSLSTSTLFKAAKADLPTSGLRDGARAWCSNGLKPGETTGTGVPVYYDATQSLWLSYRTDAEVQV